MPVDLRNFGQKFADISVDGLSIEGWNQIDVVGEGLANDGSEDAGQFIEDHADDNTLLVFPPGTYSFDTTANIGGVEKFGLICPTGRALFTEGEIDESEDMIEMGTSDTPVESCLISGFTTDTSAARFVEIYGSGLVEDIRFTAEKEFSESGEATTHISARVFDEEKTLTFKDVLMPEGGAFGEPVNDAAGGWYIHSDTAGTIRFIDCEASGFPDNGIYASAPGESEGEGGTIHVEGGRFRDNNVASVRIGGNGSSVRDATFVFENPDSDFTGVRGVYARNGSGHVVENNRFETASGVSDVSHITVTSECGSTAFENNYHVDEGSSRAIRVDDTTDSKENRVTIEGLELYGSSDGEEYPVFIERGHTKISEPAIVQPNRSAIWIDANDVVLENEDIEVDGNDVLNEGDRFVRNGVSPNDGDPSSEGAWSENVSLANKRGVLVYDTSATPPTRYLASPDDSFIAVADDPHDNDAHSETFAVDGDEQPPETHDNDAHSETFAVDGDEQPPETHDNDAHTTDYTDTSPSDVNSSNWDDYEIQKDGTDGDGIINFKTE